MEEESRKRIKEVPAAGWEVIYCSLALILVALFAMLVSYSSIEKDRIKHFHHGAGSIPEGSEQREIVMQTMQSLKIYLTQAGLDKSVNIEKTERGFKITFGSNVLFPSGVAEINKDARPCLDEMIKIAQNNPFSVRVEGHTDSVPINTPEFPSNWELSTTRAVNILRYFLEKGELPANRLAAVGFSQYHPVASNDVFEGRQKNRRVEFYFEL